MHPVKNIKKDRILLKCRNNKSKDKYTQDNEYRQIHCFYIYSRFNEFGGITKTQDHFPLYDSFSIKIKDLLNY